MNLSIKNSILTKLASASTELFFQFKVSEEKLIQFDFLSNAIIDFFELNDIIDLETKNDPFLLKRLTPEGVIKWNDNLKESIINQSPLQLDVDVVLPRKGTKRITITATPEITADKSLVYFGKVVAISFKKNNCKNIKIDQERLHFATAASNVGVWDWNLITGEVYYSPESLEILEINNTDFLVSNPEEWDARVHPDDLEMYFYNMNEHFEGRLPYYETCHRVLCNGKYKWILDRGKIIQRDKQGKPQRIIGTHTDVSSQKEKEEKLLQTLELVNNQKNKLLNFAHIVSHNLRNHTANLSSLIEMNETGMMSQQETCQYVKKVSEGLASTLSNLIELVEIQSENKVDREDLNVNEYLKKVFSVLLDDIQNNNVEIINNVPDDFKVNIIPAYLESILLNLTTNAIKYSNPKKQPLIAYSVEQQGDYKVLIVADNGLGIDLVRHKENIFGLYKTFHAHKDSTGIGLHITKNQIESMGGKIEVESKIDEGTTFRIYFKIETKKGLI
jgi:signal transduction histidine kinase